MSKRSKVAYAGMGGDEPSFLKAFKARVGYQDRLHIEITPKMKKCKVQW